MVPYLFVGIEFGRVAGEVLDSDLLLAFRGIPLHGSASMVTSAIGDYDDRTAGVGVKLLQEVHKSRTIHPTLEAGEFHVAARTDRTDQLQAKPVSAVFNLGCLPDLAPGRASVRIGADAVTGTVVAPPA